MRDLVLTAIVGGLLPVCFVRPWIGVLVWSWLGYMNPHRLTYGFATSVPFALLVALATLSGLLFAKDRRPIPWVRETYLLVALWVMYTLTTVCALYPEAAWPQWSTVTKVLLFTFVTMQFFQDWKRLRDLFIVIACSVGFYGLKGGIWAIVTGGANRVYGPDASFLGSNNSIGLALNMVLPFLFILQRDEPRQWLRRLMQAMFWMSIVAVIFTYSRGAFLGLVVVLGLLFLRASKRFWGGLVALSLGVLLFLTVGSSLVPDKWWERMGTIATYNEDQSAQERFEAWRVAFGLARDRPLVGGGFWALPHPEMYLAYGRAGIPRELSAHSIYFAVLGDHGFVTLALFISLILSCLGSLVHLRRTVGRLPEGEWLIAPAHMLEASIAAYMVSGAFLTEAYFDLFYHLVSAVVILKVLGREIQLRSVAVQPAEAAKRVTRALRLPKAVES
jgi:putative inorganic carbon (hco3(-)) transporter